MQYCCAIQVVSEWRAIDVVGSAALLGALVCSVRRHGVQPDLCDRGGLHLM